MTPLLWHLKVSSYNEKARWALDYKRVPHVRHAAHPGAHQKIAAKLTDGASTTFPVLLLDGATLADSTDIIAALERRHPEPPLYPSDPELLRRALELEAFFDEELGPYVRLLVVAETLPEPGLFLEVFVPDLGGRRRIVARAMFPVLRRRIRAAFEIDEHTVDEAFQKIAAAGERFRRELGPFGYLCGDAFSVADLAVAALAAPAVAPEGYPYPQAQRNHPRLAPLRDALAEAGILDWTQEMYARHRGSTAEVVTGL